MDPNNRKQKQIHINRMAKKTKNLHSKEKNSAKAENTEIRRKYL